MYRAVVGCDQRGNTGYRGRIGLHEQMVADDELRKLIQERARVVDADVLEWLKSEGSGYQSRLNNILRAAMLDKARHQ